MIARRLKSLGLDLRINETPRPPAARIGWENHLVTQRGPDDGEYPSADRERVRAARAAYDAGTHEMFTVTVTTQDGRWTQLYLRPRKQPTQQRRYFTREGA